jgi:hypothetical protein
MEIGPLLFVLAGLVGLALAIAIDRPVVSMLGGALLVLAGVYLAAHHPARPADSHRFMTALGFGANLSITNNLFAPPLVICGGVWMLAAAGSFVRRLVRAAHA